MFWLWDWMVFFSFGICVPVDVVLWHISLLWKFLPEGPKGEGRPCRCCNCGNGVFCRAAGHSSLLFSILDVAIHFQVHMALYISKQNRFQSQEIACAMWIKCWRKSTKNVDTRLFLHCWRLPSWLQ